jgi:hypothetical protein
MNRRQKLVQRKFLKNEQAVISRLQFTYDAALSDINQKIRNLEFRIGDLTEVYDWMDPDDPEREKIKSMIQSKIYQKNYQEALQAQLDGILNQMQNKQFLTVSDYLNTCYEDGFVGSIFDLHGQNVPLMMPLDQTKMVRAIQLESKISKGLYTRLGEDVALLKKKITAQVSRSIATGDSFAQTAQQLAGQTRIGYNRAIRIARTEGHRIQCTAADDVAHGARDRGADVLKQWDAALDGKTRESHVAVDGQICELDDRFSNGLKFPGDPAGGAAEVVNCRCAYLQRARWALKEGMNPDTGEVMYTEDEGFTKWNNFSRQLETFDRPEDYGEFKKGFFSPENKKYMNYVQQMEDKYHTRDFQKLLGLMSEQEYNYYSRLLANNPMYNKRKDNIITTPKQSGDTWYNKNLNTLQTQRIDYNPVVSHTTTLTDDEIITALAGGDKTQGSCASVGLAYIGQKQGWNVLDFRDGQSRRVFSRASTLDNIARMDGMKVIRADGACSLTVGNRLLKQCESGKEYYLCVGRHAAIVRKQADGKLQYLELQSATKSGWTDFNGNPKYTLKHRFGCSSTSSSSSLYDYMLDLNDSDFTSNDDFRTLLGYLNTAEDEQRKGSSGTIK